MLIEKSIFDFSEEIVNNFLLQSSTKSTLLLVFNFSKDLLEYEKDSESKAVITHFRSFSCEKFQFLEVFYIILIVIYICGIGFGIYSNLKGDSTVIQKPLLLLPTFKCIECLSIFVLLIKCPWTDKISYIYLQLLKSSLSFTLEIVNIPILAICISYGLGFARKSLPKQKFPLSTLILFILNSIPNFGQPLFRCILSCIFSGIFIKIIWKNFKEIEDKLNVIYALLNIRVIKYTIDLCENIKIMLTFYFIFKSTVNIADYLTSGSDINQIIGFAYEVIIAMYILALMYILRPTQAVEITEVLDIDLISAEVVRYYKQFGLEPEVQKCIINMRKFDKKHRNKYSQSKKSETSRVTLGYRRYVKKQKAKRDYNTPIIIMNPEETADEKYTKEGIISRLWIAKEVNLKKIKRRRSRRNQNS